MDRKINPTGQQSLLDFLREQAFSTDLRQRTIGDHVARGPDHLDDNAVGRNSIRRGDFLRNQAGLRQRQRASAATDPDQGGADRGLHRETSQWQIKPGWGDIRTAISPKSCPRKTLANKGSRMRI
jgi:hypothetical protein